MSDHTRGPWRRKGWYVHGADDSIVCRVIPWDECGTREEDQGNVNLIEDAPRLLELLAKLHDYAEHCMRYKYVVQPVDTLHSDVQAILWKHGAKQ